jgi:hypothetical protein
VAGDFVMGELGSNHEVTKSRGGVYQMMRELSAVVPGPRIRQTATLCHAAVSPVAECNGNDPTIRRLPHRLCHILIAHLAVWRSPAGRARIPCGFGFAATKASRLQRCIRQPSMCPNCSRRV